MRIPLKFWASHAIALLLGVCIANGNAVGADKLHWVVTNDDVPPSLTNSASFFAVGTGGQLTLKNKVLLGRGGLREVISPPIGWQYPIAKMHSVFTLPSLRQALSSESCLRRSLSVARQLVPSMS